MSSQFFAGLDIGTSSVKGVVAQVKDGRLLPRLFLKEVSSGVRKGAIVDLVETSPSVVRVVSEIRRFSKSAADNLYVGIGTSEIKSQVSKGIVAVSRADNEINQEDKDRVIRASQAVNISANRTIIHSDVREYMVDGVGDISDPVGLSGTRLEAISLIIDAFSAHFKSLVKAVELSGGEIRNTILTPLAASRAVLTKRQKELGVAMLDIGGGTTGLAVYDEGKLIGAAKFPAGSDNISKDIGIGLKVPVSVGDEIKLKYGSAISKSVGAKESIDMASLYPEGKGQISRRFVCEIIESRLAEILEFANNEIKAMNRSGSLAGGVVLAGGGSKLPGISELSRQELKLTSQLALPDSSFWDPQSMEINSSFDDPEYAVCLGLVVQAMNDEGIARNSFSPLSAAKKWLKYLQP
jgi:cell division protein FtsA